MRIGKLHFTWGTPAATNVTIVLKPAEPTLGFDEIRLWTPTPDADLTERYVDRDLSRWGTDPDHG